MTWRICTFFINLCKKPKAGFENLAVEIKQLIFDHIVINPEGKNQLASYRLVNHEWNDFFSRVLVKDIGECLYQLSLRQEYYLLNESPLLGYYMKFVEKIDLQQLIKKRGLVSAEKYWQVLADYLPQMNKLQQLTIYGSTELEWVRPFVPVESLNTLEISDQNVDIIENNRVIQFINLLCVDYRSTVERLNNLVLTVASLRLEFYVSNTPAIFHQHVTKLILDDNYNHPSELENREENEAGHVFDIYTIASDDETITSDNSEIDGDDDCPTNEADQVTLVDEILFSRIGTDYRQLSEFSNIKKLTYECGYQPAIPVIPQLCRGVIFRQLERLDISIHTSPAEDPTGISKRNIVRLVTNMPNLKHFELITNEDLYLFCYFLEEVERNNVVNWRSLETFHIFIHFNVFTDNEEYEDEDEDEEEEEDDEDQDVGNCLQKILRHMGRIKNFGITATSYRCEQKGIRDFTPHVWPASRMCRNLQCLVLTNLTVDIRQLKQQIIERDDNGEISTLFPNLFLFEADIIFDVKKRRMKRWLRLHFPKCAFNSRS